MSNTTQLFQLKTYADAVNFVDGLDIAVQKLGLERISTLMSLLGNPQNQFPCVHVAGTNGKGSTIAMLSAILKEAGYKTGTMISPHLRHVRERIAINSNPILQEDFLNQTRFLQQMIQQHFTDKNNWPTYFEFLTALGFQHFKNKNVDIALVEVGMGGRLDGTNVINHPNLSIITHIGLDHMAHLGNTTEAIAREKAGIIKVDSPILIGAGVSEEAATVIEAIASNINSPVYYANANNTEKTEHLNIASESSLENGLIVNDTQHGLTYKLPLVGQYTINNLATVLKAVELLRQQQFAINNEHIVNGLQKAHWPARFEYLKQQRIILDGSHNEDGLNALSQDIETYLKEKPLIWLVSLKTGKDPDPLINLLKNHIHQSNLIIFTGHPEDNFHDPEVLKTLLKKVLPDKSKHAELITKVNTKAATTDLKNHLENQPNLTGIITGSLYTAGSVLSQLD